MGEKSVRGAGLDAARYAFLVEESGVVISTHRPGDWAYTSVNARIYETMGYTPEELMGVPAYFYFHPDDIERIRQRTIPAVYSQGTRIMRYRHRHKDGHYLWVEGVHRSIRDPDTGELKEIITVSRDLTTQHKAEMAAKRLERVMESSAEHVLFCDQAMQLSYLNASARDSLMIEPDSLPSLQQVLTESCCKELKNLFTQVLKQRNSWAGSLPIKTQKKNEKILELHELQWHGENELLVGGEFFGLILRDLTEQRKAEQLERERQQELALAGRLMTMGEMATGLAHEINQPLATILNYSRGAQRRIENNSLQSLEQILPVMESIDIQAQRASDIIKRLRSMVKKTPYQRMWFNLNTVCHSVVSFLQHEWEVTGISVQLSLAEEPPKLEADVIQIEQVLINLLRNAIEAYEDKKLTNKQIVLYTQKLPSAVVFGVKDYAGGIEPEQQAQLFEPYFTTKPSGLGMGLSISRSIIEAHSGRISLATDGTTYKCFEIKLPIKN